MDVPPLVKPRGEAFHANKFEYLVHKSELGILNLCPACAVHMLQLHVLGGSLMSCREQWQAEKFHDLKGFKALLDL